MEHGRLSDLKHQAVYEWRKQISASLQKCSIFFTTAESAKAQLISALPFLSERQFEVIPHGRTFIRTDQPAVAVSKNEPFRILIAGNISLAKGGAIASELAKRSEELGIEVHILGKVAKAVKIAGAKLHGPYDREAFVDKVRAVNPHVGGIFSLWPETYCHTLTELWASGIPVIGLPFGAVQERILATGGGWCAEDASVESIVKIIVRLRRNPAELAAIRNNVFKLQNNPDEFPTVDNMARTYYEKYSSLAV